MGPMLSLKGIDNATYYRLVAGRSPLLHGLYRHRQHAERAQSAGAKMIMDSLRYWVTRDARRRLPLRSGGTLARELHDVEQTVELLRHHPPGPDHSPM